MEGQIVGCSLLVGGCNSKRGLMQFSEVSRSFLPNPEQTIEALTHEVPPRTPNPHAMDLDPKLSVNLESKTSSRARAR